MKKIFLTVLTTVGFLAQAQLIHFGVRANALFSTSSSSWKDISNTAKGAFQNPKDATGFNVGLSAKINFPVTSFFVMPEIYYTNYSNKISYSSPAVPEQNGTVELSAKTNRVDIPVLLGYNIVQPLSAFIGPVFSTDLSGKNTFKDFKEEEKKDFSVGYQFGANLNLSNFIINARYEGSLSKDQRKFVNSVSNQEINYDNRPSFFIVGLGYNF